MAVMYLILYGLLSVQRQNIYLFFCLVFRCKKWVVNLRRDDLHGKSPEALYKNNVVCALHFEDSQFMNPFERNKLIHCAVPSLFDIPNPPKKVTPSRPPPKKRQPPDTHQPPSKRACLDTKQSPAPPSTNQCDNTPIEDPQLSPRKKSIKKQNGCTSSKSVQTTEKIQKVE